MAHSMENSTTPSKRRNSTVYVAKTSTGDNSINSSQTGFKNVKSRPTGETATTAISGEFPRRDSVSQIKNAFEEVVKSAADCAQRDSVGGKLREILINKKTEGSDKISMARGTCRPRSQSVQGNCCSALHPHSVNSANSKLQVSCDSDKSVGQTATDSAQQQDSKTCRPGTLVLQPASNVRGPLAKAEYLSLSKFTDVKTYSCSKKRPKMTVDELDKRLESSLPVNQIDEATEATYENDLQSLQEFDKEIAYEFVGAGVKGNRAVLKMSKSSVNKKVSFCLRSTSVFEYPAEEVETGSGASPAELNSASESNESEPDGNQLNVTSKSFQSSPVRSATGKLGSYQSRLLEHCDLSPRYSIDSPLTSSPLSQQQQLQYFETNDQCQRVNTVQPLFVNSCSADEQSRPWSDGNSGTELLF